MSSIKVSGRYVSTEYYSYDYDETDFNDDCKKFDIHGITWKSLVEIFEGKKEDQPIEVAGAVFGRNKGEPFYASDFFEDLMQDRLMNVDKPDSYGDGEFLFDGESVN